MKEEELENNNSGLSFELQSLIQADKALITDISKHIVAKVANGELDPVKAFLHNKKILELATLNDKNLRPYFNDHAKVSKGETSIQYNVKISQAETGVKYDYKVCGDKIYDDLMEEKEKLDIKIKEREAFLKTIKSKTGVFDPDTSEGWEINPPLRSGTLGYKTELK